MVTTESRSGDEPRFRIPDSLYERGTRDPEARAWIESLPELCRRLSRLWGVSIGHLYAGCTVSWVAPADGATAPAVIKIPAPCTVDLATVAGGFRDREAIALRIWAGDGAPVLFEHDTASGAILMERCSPGRSLDSVEPREADEVWARLMARLHRPADDVVGIDRLGDRAAAVAGSLPGRSSRLAVPLDPSLVARASWWLTDLAAPSGGEVLLHGDPHHHNILSSTRSGWVAIDPLPMIGDPAYDAVQYLLFCKGDLDDPAGEWPAVIDRVCGLADLDPDRVRRWTFARLVSDAVAAAEQGAGVDDLEARHGELWTARLLL